MKLWIARERTNILYLYRDKPVRLQYGFLPSTSFFFKMADNSLFPEVTFENSPQQVEIKLIKNE